MHFRSRAALAPALLLAAPTAIVAPVLAQETPKPPQQALISAARNREVTLAAGRTDGVVIGAIYRLTRGNVSGRFQVTSVRDAESTAVLLSADDGFIATVGDTAQFVEVKPLGATPGTTPPPAVPTPSGPLNPTPTTPVATTPGEAAAKATIIGVTGRTVTLDITAETGARVGAIYVAPPQGGVKVRMQVTQVRANNSVAQIYESADDFTLTVGEGVRFETIRPLGGATTPPVQAPTTSGTPVPPVPPTTVNPPTMTVPGSLSPTANVTTVSSGSIKGSSALITATTGSTVTIGAGSAQGITTGTNLPIIRSGQVIGLLRVQLAAPGSAQAIVLWRDESVSPIAVGDEVGILNAPSVGAPRPLVPEDATIPAVAVKYETGASNEVVPKADITYEMLAGLAARGYITSQPASVFADEGTRRHSASEDITFSKGQIAGFIREAIDNQTERDDDKPPIALGLLAKRYQKDLNKLGVTSEAIADLQEQGFKFGTTSRFSLTATGGDKDTQNLPFAERYGSLRTKTGLDTRLTAYGQLSEKLSFYATLDGGTDVNNLRDNDKFDLRRGYISYDANSLLRGLTINLGRQEFWWGPGHFGTTLLGDAAGGLNSLHTVFKRGSYQLESLYAPLGTGPAGGARSLYGQNLSVNIGTQSKIGFANTILSPKDKFDPILFLSAFSPVALYTADRLGSKDDRTNAMVQGYFETSIARGVRTYGELLLDDFSFNENNRIENRDGSLVGAHVFDPKDPARLGLYTEYARFNSISGLTFLGATRDRDYDYFYRNTPLGYPIGPVFPPGSNTTLGGAESLRLEGYWMPTKKLRLTGGVEFSDINAEDQATGPAGSQGFSRQQIYRIGATYDISQAFSLSARFARVATDQPNFVKLEPSVRDHLFSFQVNTQF